MQFPPPPEIPRTPLIPLFEDEHLLAFDKPSGLLCVPGRGPDKQDCLVQRVLGQWPDALVVHRLDMATSGIVQMARSPDMQRAMSAAFAERQVHKTYEAVVAGRPTTSAVQAWNVVDAPILLDWPNRPIHIIDPAGKPSVTRWRVLEHATAQTTGSEARDIIDTTRLALQPVTGRTHQLRVHMLYIGLPILGDVLYAPQNVRYSPNRLMLHARVLELTHPASGRSLTIQSPVPF